MRYLHHLCYPVAHSTNGYCSCGCQHFVLETRQSWIPSKHETFFNTWWKIRVTLLNEGSCVAVENQSTFCAVKPAHLKNAAEWNVVFFPLKGSLHSGNKVQHQIFPHLEFYSSALKWLFDIIYLCLALKFRSFLWEHRRFPLIFFRWKTPSIFPIFQDERPHLFTSQAAGLSPESTVDILRPVCIYMQDICTKPV